MPSGDRLVKPSCEIEDDGEPCPEEAIVKHEYRPGRFIWLCERHKGCGRNYLTCECPIDTDLGNIWRLMCNPPNSYQSCGRPTISEHVLGKSGHFWSHIWLCPEHRKALNARGYLIR